MKSLIVKKNLCRGLIVAALLMFGLYACKSYGKSYPKNVCNPCAKNVCNPCAKKIKNVCNPCATKVKNVCNPCANRY